MKPQSFQQDSDDDAGVPQRLRAVIADSGMSQAKFAAHVGIDLDRLKGVLRGKTRRPPLDLLQKVIKRCNVDSTWLFTGMKLDVGETTPLEKALIADFRLLKPAEQYAIRRAAAARGDEPKLKTLLDELAARRAEALDPSPPPDQAPACAARKPHFKLRLSGQIDLVSPGTEAVSRFETQAFSTEQLAQAKKRITDTGQTLADWARKRDLDYNTVSLALQGRLKGLRGEGYRVCVALGLREVSSKHRRQWAAVPSHEEAALVHLHDRGNLERRAGKVQP
ncbi:MAG: helix-turn-helix domain-containing protein [Betaproteobacteria bacterium]|jgi:gp16 family phage-associated protein|nr:helix-turn-helix domain-containing protein [Rubrivivax sp.]